MKPTEAEATAWVVGKLGHDNPCLEAGGNITYKIKGTTVCSEFFCRAYGFWNGKLNNIRSLLYGKCTGEVVHGNMGCKRVLTTSKYLKCVSFWDMLFKFLSERPNQDHRLFPVNMSYKHIYKEYFVPWMKKEHADVSEDKYPKMETFRQARHDDNFADACSQATQASSLSLLCVCNVNRSWEKVLARWF